MSIRISNSTLRLRNNTTGEMQPVSMFGSGADKTMAEIREYAQQTKDDIVSESDTAKAAIKAKTDEQVARIPEVTDLAADVNSLKGDVADLDRRTYAILMPHSDNLLDPNTGSEKGTWWYEGKKNTGATTGPQAMCRSYRIDVEPNKKYYFAEYRKSNHSLLANSSVLYLNVFDSSGVFIEPSGSSYFEYTMPSNASYIVCTFSMYSPYGGEEVDGENLIPAVSSNPMPSVLEEYKDETELTGEYILDRLNGLREVVFVKKEDNDMELLLKMLAAFKRGNTDVFFEKATYTLKEAYLHMWNVLMWRWGNGLPIGNGCRYYFNDSTIISDCPDNPPDALNDERNILDCRTFGSDYEVHDVTLINNGGRYCIHDEGNSSKVPYLHKYENVVMIYNKTELTTDNGCKAFGCGAGFDASLLFDGCVFKHNNGQDVARLAVHAPTSNPNNEPCRLHFSMKNCYFDKGSVHINQSLRPTSAEDGNFVKDVDTLDCFLFGNSFGSEFNSISANVIENNNTIRTN